MSHPPMRLAYADPPYLGMCSYYKHEHGDGGCWNDITTHRELVDRLVSDYPDGWALSMSSTNLQDVLPLCPPKVRVAAWVKPFASFKPNQDPAYTWEPVLFVRTLPKVRELTTRDYLAESITLRRGFTGAKPLRFNQWVLDLLGFRHGIDTLDDLFPGTGGMAAAVAQSALDFGGAA